MKTQSFPRLLVCGLAALVFGAAGARAAAQSPLTSQPSFASAQWIAPPADHGADAPLPRFRKEFQVERSPRRATLRVIGLGDYEPRVNGRRLAATGLNQPWSQYEKTLYFRDFDLTPVLRVGSNVVGIQLANSFWHNLPVPAGRYYKDGPQRTASEPLLLRAEVILEGRDGGVSRVGTDESWRVAAGPVTFSHIFAGEDYDARRETPGWDRPGFDDRTWRVARVVAAPGAELLPQIWPAIVALGRLAPEAVRESAPGVWLYSFPQNCAAQVRLRISGGKAGDRIELRGGEHRNREERLFGNYVVGWTVVTHGRPLTHQWQSFYLGMQFVEVAGAVPRGRPNPRGLPVIERLELVPVRAGLATVGTFDSSSPVLNGTHRIVDQAMQANAQHVLTDCPHREKLGWLEVAYLMAPSFQYRYDCRAWFNKILRDIRDAQEPDGRVLTVAPSYPAGRFPGAFNYTVEWGAAAALLPWQQYEWTGDPAVLRENFEAMRRFTDHVSREAKDGLAAGGLGDWYDYGHGQPPGPSRFTPTELSATVTWALCARAVARAAEALGRPEEARQYRELHARIAADFQRHFRDPATGRLRHRGSPQCANAMALVAEVVPAADREQLVAEIIADLEQRGWQQTAGDVGHVYFIRALAAAGRSDALHRVYAREGLGSYGGVLKKGLTAMPETWDAMMDGYQSLNHCMLGHVVEWLYGEVAGIRQAPGSVGWRKVLLAPAPGPLTRAAAEVRTPRGLIGCRWVIEGGKFRLTARVPAGVEAVAVLPSGAAHPLRPGRQSLAEDWPARSAPGR
jgi:hypothetical protein